MSPFAVEVVAWPRKRHHPTGISLCRKRESLLWLACERA
jgi:hypothetical protein